MNGDTIRLMERGQDKLGSTGTMGDSGVSEGGGRKGADFVTILTHMRVKQPV